MASRWPASLPRQHAPTPFCWWCRHRPCAARLGLDPGSATVLERYQRWRRFDTVTMGIATDGLNRLFSNSSDVLRLVRDVGLGLVDQVPNLKRLFIREAAGLVGDVPKLLRGEML